ncbi:MAG: hypothetical protein PHG91_08560 [Syntrophales bacterium]|nr:hypothetical protein [Syntrophales bacterium]MDD5233433.1 hypothetical protein [Syntrophales bacterium]MDD5534105.1 hypothetical protein [Syntrophales bacterium]
MKRSWVAAAVLLSTLFFAAGCGTGESGGKTEKKAEAQEFSATVVSTSAGQSFTSKVYMKPGKFRTDNEAAGTSVVARKDLGKVWMIMKSQNTYMETPEAADEQISAAGDKVKGEVSRKKIGSETVGGHPSAKYEVTAKVDGKAVQIYQWWATDVNLPVRTAAADGSWVMEYRDVRLGSQPDSLFEIPSGYKRVAVPGMPKGMKINLPGADSK